MRRARSVGQALRWPRPRSAPRADAAAGCAALGKVPAAAVDLEPEPVGGQVDEAAREDRLELLAWRSVEQP
eukprot:5430119-Prymnesium_polylepis.1